MDEKSDLIKKFKKKIFFRGKRVFLIRNDARNPKKMVSTFYNDDFGSKIAFFDVLARYCV